MGLTVHAADGAGAYVSDVDLSTIDRGEIAALREALGQFGVLFFVPNL